MDYPFVNNEKNLEQLLRAFILISRATEGKSVGDNVRLLDAESLVVKFFFHALSVLYLVKGTHVKSLDVSYFDFASINVLARAAMETFLVFNHVFIDPTDDELRDFRHLTWTLAGKIDKEKVVSVTKAKQEEKRSLRKEIKYLQDTIKKNKYFQELNGKKQKWFLKGNFRDGWSELGEAAGLSKVNAGSFYKYLCGFAHSSSYSLEQIYSAHRSKEQEYMLRTAISLINMVAALMAKRSMNLFSLDEEVFAEEKELLDLLNFFYDLGVTPMDTV